MMKISHFLLRLVLLCALLLVSAAAPVAAQSGTNAGVIRYLTPTGTDAGDCTSMDAPCLTVQYAINQASAEDSLFLAAGTYTTVQNQGGVNQIAYLDKTLSLYGGYDAAFTGRSPDSTPTILDAASLGRVIYVSGPITATLDGLQLINGSTESAGGGHAGGGLYASGATLILNNVQIKDNRSGFGDGGGIYLTGGVLNMTDCLVDGNRYIWGNDSYSQGGGVAVHQSDATISSSTISNNTTASVGYSGTGYGGGAVFDTSNAILRDVIFRNNLAAVGDDGFGGALSSHGGTLLVEDSTFDHNIPSTLDTGYGGAISLYTNNAVFRGNTFINNYAKHIAGVIYINYNLNAVFEDNTFKDNSTNGGGGAIATYGFGVLQFTNNRFIHNQAATGGAVYFDEPGMIAFRALFQDNLFQDNQASGSGGAVYYSGFVDFLDNRFIENHAGNTGGAIQMDEKDRFQNGTMIYDGNYFRGNSAGVNGGALCLNTIFSENLITNFDNMVFIDNSAVEKGGAVYSQRYANTPYTFNHATFKGNTAGDGAAFTAWTGHSALVNSIVADSEIGLYIRSNSALDHVLFDGVAQPVFKGVDWVPINPDVRLTGDAAFDLDGYHLLGDSAAVDAGIASTIVTDIDNNPRPFGAAPDLGADESPFSTDDDGMQAWMIASQPEWKVYYTGINVPPSTEFEQTYLIPFANYNATRAAASYSIHDEFPALLNLFSVEAHPELTYTPAGNSLAWTSQTSLQPGGWGWISLIGRSDSVTPGTELLTSGQLDYTLTDETSGSIPFEASTIVPERPLFPPLLLYPQNGEMCLDVAGQLTASGLASAGQTVKLYEDGHLKATTVADESGEYSVTWVSDLETFNSVQLYTVSCEPGGDCSEPSGMVYISYPEGNWCPQRSFWEGDVGSTHFEFHFRNDAGAYATQDFLIPGVYGFNNTRLHLYSCCQGEVNPFRVMADGVEYKTPDGHDGHMWEFNIAGAHDVAIYSDCQGADEDPEDDTDSEGVVLIDPDGFIFDQSQGGSMDPVTGMFDPAQPLAGFTVTAYYWAEEWNSWIVWPAHLFDDQVNPQVTPASGYFAFFTPPGFYYLQVTGKDGYQSWRSPLIEVVSEIVHMNAPLTNPGTPGEVIRIQSKPSGLSQTTVRVPVNGSVEWVAGMESGASADTLVEMNTHPLQRLLSIANPLLDTTGWDSGMLAPGQAYVRTFTQEGIYPYTDGYGHAGTILVGSGSKVYLPLVVK